MDDGALHHLITELSNCNRGRFKEKQNSNKLQHTFFMRACTATHTSGPASKRELRPLSQSGIGAGGGGGVVSDHLIGLAPDRQRSPHQPARQS